MLNALSNYLQHLPHPSQNTATAAAALEGGHTTPLQDAELQGGYVPSSRAIMVSAIASDFDVRALERQDIGQLQLKLQQYGLLNGRDLDAFSLISTQAQDDTQASIDALGVLDQVTQEFNQRNIPYSERQNINHLHRLLHNLDSARQLLVTPDAANA